LIVLFHKKLSIDQNRVVLKDNKRNRIAEVMLKEGELQCLLDEKADCVHVGYVYSLPELYNMNNQEIKASSPLSIWTNYITSPTFFSLPLYLQYSPLYILIMLMQIQMSNNHMQKTIDDSYEILELNASEPIIFEANDKIRHGYNEKNDEVILIVPKESQTRRRLNS
jgi:hypothetical protein